jgi:protein tyrosine phosphatase type 4A
MSRVASRLQNPPTLIELDGQSKLRFLIMDAPTNENLQLYLDATNGLDVGQWVRCCEASSYDEKRVQTLGIRVHNMNFPDGEAPPPALIARWLDLCFSSDCTIAVHCVAGLGRAPLLVAIALMESGMPWEEAVDLIRRKRRGAINRVQLKYVQEYKPIRKKASGNACVLM